MQRRLSVNATVEKELMLILAYRMKKYNLSFEDALKMPRMTNGRPRKEVANA